MWYILHIGIRCIHVNLVVFNIWCISVFYHFVYYIPSITTAVLPLLYYRCFITSTVDHTNLTLFVCSQYFSFWNQNGKSCYVADDGTKMAVLGKWVTRSRILGIVNINIHKVFCHFVHSLFIYYELQYMFML